MYLYEHWRCSFTIFVRTLCGTSVCETPTSFTTLHHNIHPSGTFMLHSKALYTIIQRILAVYGTSFSSILGKPVFVCICIWHQLISDLGISCFWSCDIVCILLDFLLSSYVVSLRRVVSIQRRSLVIDLHSRRGWCSGWQPQVWHPGLAYRQFRFMAEKEVHTSYNSQKVTAASV